MLTTAYTDLDIPAVTEGVYVPQEDTQLLIDIMDKTGLARGQRVAVREDHHRWVLRVDGNRKSLPQTTSFATLITQCEIRLFRPYPHSVIAGRSVGGRN